MRILIAMLVVLAACAPAQRPEPPDFVERVSGSYRPDDADRAEIRVRVQDYFAALRQGDYARAYGFLTLDYQEELSFNAFRLANESHHALAHRMTQVHWLKDSHRMPGPELFAVVDWAAGAPEAPVAEGRQVWRQTETGAFLIQSEEAL